MKTDTLKKWVRRSVVLALGACIVAGATGCFHDDEDKLPDGWAMWVVDWTGDDSGVNPVKIPLPLTDLNAAFGQSEMEHFDPYTITVDIDNVGNITVQIWD